MIERTEHVRWRRAEGCASNACVEVGVLGEHYLIRDSKNPETEPLRFNRQEWMAFLAAARAGDFDF